MATALRLPERDFLYEVRADQHLKKTHSPETLEGVVWTKPPKGAIPILVRDIVLQRAKRPDRQAAPCPICCPNAPKYLQGALAWFKEEAVYRCIGFECIARLCGEDAAHKVRRNFDKTKSLDADYAFAFDKIGLAPTMRTYLEALVPAAEHAEKLRRDLGRSQVKGNLSKLMKQNDGQLVVWDVQEVERFEPNTHTIQTRKERVSHTFGPIAGPSALADDLPLSKNLRVHLGRLSVFCIPDAEERVINSYSDHQSLSSFRKALYESIKLKRSTEQKIEDVLAFFHETNFRRLQKYGSDHRSEFPMFAVVRDGTFRIGPTRLNAIAIRPDFEILENLPDWPELD